MASNMKTERERYEQWAERHCFTLTHHPRADDQYADNLTAAHWNGWWARAQLDTEQMPPLVNVAEFPVVKVTGREGTRCDT